MLTEEKVLIPAAHAKQYHPEQYNGTKFSDPYTWGMSTIRAILSRQEYLGHTVLRKSVSTNFKLHKRKNTDEEEQYVFYNTHEPIISQELWDSVQKRKKRANRTATKGTHSNRLSGYLYCADCGRRMTLQTHYSKKDRSVQYSYRCGGYASRVNACTAHSISADNVEALILSAVKRLSKFVLNDEEAFAKELQALWNEKQTEKPKHNKSELHRFQKRYDELSKLIRGLYENLVSGLLPERQYKQLMKQYDDEQAELETKIEEMEKELTEEKANTVDIKHFISLIRKCKEPTEISDLMFAELIDKIVVYEAAGMGKARTQKVDIYFNYVGQVDIAYTEEELAEIKAQEEQIEMERLAKQREREKAYREKRKAKKLAENGGEIVKTKICPHCQKEFVPTSNRQIFCSKDCCYQARQDMLKITNDGRKLALDQRLINPLLPDFEDSKLNACVDAMFETWERGSEKRLTQLFFCDLSTPKNDGSFNVYDDIRQKLIARGVPADEIKFIHEADTEAKKLELFKKVRRGDVRILMGSTQKMGAGTNVQNKLAASSDLDCPWRPSDLEQRLGRSIRQGNENAEVHIYRFVTEETFDAYLYQLVEGKQKFASQIMTSKSPVRSCEDIDETALSYAEIKMLATGNPHIKEKMDLDIQVQKLRLLKSSFLSEKYALEDKIIKFYPQEIARRSDVIAGLKSDIERVAEHPKPSDETFVGMTVKGAFYSEKADAGNAILEACKAMTNPDPIPLGEYRGFTMELYFEAREYKVRLKGELGYPVTLGTDTFGNITRLDNALEGLPKRLEMNEMELDNLKKQFETAKVDVERPFPQEEELKAKTDRLNELNALLNVDKRENEIVGGEPDEGDEPPEKKPRDLER